MKPTPAAADESDRRTTLTKVALTGAVALAALSLTGGGTFAGFSDTKSLTNTTGLDTASLSLSLSQVSTASLTTAVAGLLPGDTVSRAVDLIDTGSGSFTPTLAVTATNNALTQSGGLTLNVQLCSAGTWNASASACTGTVSSLYSGPLVTAGATLTGLTMSGGTTAHLRTVITLPSTVTDSVSGLSTGTLTLSFSGAFPTGGSAR